MNKAISEINEVRKLEEEKREEFLKPTYIKNKSICSLPFKHIYTDNTGLYKLCCHGALSDGFTKDWNMQEHDPFEYFESQDMEKIRTQMIKGEPVKDCNVCYEKEKKGSFSDRMKHTRVFRPEDLMFTKRFMELKLTLWGNFCNLSCAMCHPVHSSKRTTELNQMIPIMSEDLGNIIGKMFEWKGSKTKLTSERRKEIIKDISDKSDIIKAISISSDGEPLQNKNMYDFLAAIPDKDAEHIDVTITTNLSEVEFNEYHLDQIIERYPSTTLRVSSDHIEEKYEWIRWPGDFDKLCRNLEMYKDYVFMVSPAVQILNIEDVVEIKLFYESMGMTCFEAGSYSVVSGPRIMSCGLHSRNAEIAEELKLFDWASPIVFELERMSNHSPDMQTRDRRNMEEYLTLLSKERGDWKILFGNL